MKTLIITADGIDDTQRSQIQFIVKKDSLDWWHRQENVWIVKTEESAREWRAKFTNIVHNVGASILILNVAAKAGWAGRRPGGINGLGKDWLANNLPADSVRTEEQP